MRTRSLTYFVITILFLGVLSPFAVAENNSSTLYDALVDIQPVHLESHLAYIESLGTHPTGSEALSILQTYLATTLSGYGLDVTLKHWSNEDYQGYNVEAEQNGVGDNDNLLIVCAHYDSVSQGPGIDDDASGVVSILEAARVLSSYTFNATIRYVLFSGEEQGLLGSSVYAQELNEKQENLIGLICLDAIGYAETSVQGSILRNFASGNAQWIADAGDQIISTYPDLIPLKITRYDTLEISDHASFNPYGYVTSYYFEQTLNPFYHTPEDNLEHINLTYLTYNTRLVAGSLALLAESDRLLSSEDLAITITGGLLSYPDGFHITIDNTNYADTANLSIQITFTNLFTKNIVFGVHDSICNWTIQKEIQDSYLFASGPRYIPLQPLIITVTLQGCGDDLGVYKQVQTFGLAFNYLFLTIPCFSK